MYSSHCHLLKLSPNESRGTVARSNWTRVYESRLESQGAHLSLRYTRPVAMNALLSTRVFRFRLVRSEDCCFAKVQKSQFWTFFFLFSSATRTRTTAHSLANLLSPVMAPTDSKFCSIISDLILMTSVGAALP